MRISEDEWRKREHDVCIATFCGYCLVFVMFCLMAFSTEQVVRVEIVLFQVESVVTLLLAIRASGLCRSVSVVISILQKYRNKENNIGESIDLMAEKVPCSGHFIMTAIYVAIVALLMRNRQLWPMENIAFFLAASHYLATIIPTFIELNLFISRLT